MARYIDADKLKEVIKDLPEQERIEYMGIYDVINFQPTADVQEVKHGRWKQVQTKSPKYICTKCLHLFNNKSYNYCPNCGSKNG